MRPEMKPIPRDILKRAVKQAVVSIERFLQEQK